MMSVIGNSRRCIRGFSLIEIVLVIGLVALAGSIMIANFASIVDRNGELNAEEIVQAAIQKARFDAARERSNVSLSFDKGTGDLVLSTGERLPLGPNFSKEGNGTIVFYLIPPAKGMGPFTTPANARLETKQITFAPDRSSTPFVIDLKRPNERVERLTFDTFSSLRRETQ